MSQSGEAVSHHEEMKSLCSSWNHLRRPLPLLCSKESAPPLVWNVFTVNTHPSIILLQRMRAKPAEDSVTVHNGLVAEAV